MNKRKKFKLSFWIAAGLLIYMLVIIYKQEDMFNARRAELNEVLAKIEAETEYKQQLEKEKQELFSDEHIEKVAREKLGLVRPGDKVFVDIND